MLKQTLDVANRLAACLADGRCALAQLTLVAPSADGSFARSAEVHADFTTDRLLSYTGRPVTQG